MLASIRGTVSSVAGASMVIDCGGLGYEVHVSTALASSTRSGSEIHLHTVLIPREDEWLLFGFSDTASKQLFSLLRGVSGVGPKTALAVLSHLSNSEIDDAVESGDADRFKSVPGIGAKTASLIVVSLTGKMPQASNRDVSDVIAALTGLSWNLADATEAARAVVAEAPTASLAERIRLALGRLGGSS